MRTSRFLATTLLSIVSTLPVAAQAPAGPSTAPSAPGNDRSRDTASNDATNIFQFRPIPGGFVFESKPGAKAGLDGESIKQLLRKRESIASMMHSDTRCYSIQSYRFTRTDPTSDAMRLKDSSSCQPSTQFQAKSLAIKPGDTAAH